MGPRWGGMGLRRVGVHLTACCRTGSMPTLPNSGVFRSARLFRILRRAEKIHPLLLMTCRKGSPIKGLLYVAHHSAGLLHFTRGDCTCNANRCFPSSCPGRRVFRRLLSCFARRFTRGSFLLRFHGLRRPLFNCHCFQRGKCFPVH